MAGINWYHSNEPKNCLNNILPTTTTTLNTTTNSTTTITSSLNNSTNIIKCIPPNNTNTTINTSIDYDTNESNGYNEQIPLYSLADVQLRFLCPDDLDEVRCLCQDWFPIEYPFYWYEEITSSTSRFYSLAAVHGNRIIGLIVAEIKPYDVFIEDDLGILARKFAERSDIAYILSLGVLKQYRRNGIASLLLDSLLRHLTGAERVKVKAVFLHVLTSNSAAIRFYEHRKFTLHSFLPYYYSIKGRCKDGFMYVLYINGGHPPWTLYEYIKFMCGKVISGGGLFTWMMLNFNRALHWLWTNSNNANLKQYHQQQQQQQQTTQHRDEQH